MTFSPSINPLEPVNNGNGYCPNEVYKDLPWQISYFGEFLAKSTSHHKQK